MAEYARSVGPDLNDTQSTRRNVLHQKVVAEVVKPDVQLRQDVLFRVGRATRRQGFSSGPRRGGPAAGWKKRRWLGPLGVGRVRYKSRWGIGPPVQEGGLTPHLNSGAVRDLPFSAWREVPALGRKNCCPPKRAILSTFGENQNAKRNAKCQKKLLGGP